MDRNALIKHLNWFYGLELEQVDLYTAQSKAVDDIYLSKTLERVALIEQQHVDNIADKIRELGGTPTKVGDIVAPLLGVAMGGITGLAGPLAILRTDITLEEKAMRDYKDLIIKAGKDQELFDLLWANLIDEDLHTAWFANKMRELQKIEQKQVRFMVERP
ncbi:MAG: ferritin-like domain-containing protein [Firmicutes bacterium]|nr:ferritin-like domain-containing protein [Bacillota bacterium]